MFKSSIIGQITFYQACEFLINIYISGVFSCDVESACSGRYDEIYAHFTNDVTVRRKRRGQRSTVVNEEAIVEFEIFHPCYLIKNGLSESVCPESDPENCWTADLCETDYETDESFYVLEESSASAISATISAVLLILLL